MICSKQLEHVN